MKILLQPDASSDRAGRTLCKASANTGGAVPACRPLCWVASWLARQSQLPSDLGCRPDHRSAVHITSPNKGARCPRGRPGLAPQETDQEELTARVNRTNIEGVLSRDQQRGRMPQEGPRAGRQCGHYQCGCRSVCSTTALTRWKSNVRWWERILSREKQPTKWGRGGRNQPPGRLSLRRARPEGAHWLWESSSIRGGV